jgi:hypothetical protein
MENLDQPEPDIDEPGKLPLEIFLGFLLILAFHSLQFFLLTFKTGRLLFLFFGLSQFLYVRPALYMFRRKQKRGLMIGVIFAASITFLIGLPYAGCGLMYAGVIEPPKYFQLAPL